MKRINDRFWPKAVIQKAGLIQNMQNSALHIKPVKKTNSQIIWNS
jgi:hypothetical protein